MTVNWNRATGWLGVLASAALLAVYARLDAGWWLGFGVLLPWLWSLDRLSTARAALCAGVVMSIAFVLAVFPWFATAIAAYTGIGTWTALALLALWAPLLQPHLLVYAWVRQWVGARWGRAIGALTAVCAWIGLEWGWPKLLGDTLGHGLLPAQALRQLADLAGVAGLTALLLLVHEALLAVWRRRTRGLRSWLPPALVVTCLPLAAWGYGQWRLHTLARTFDPQSPSIQVALIQSNITDYARLREELGTYAAVRQVLDTHFALSRSAIEQHGAEVLLWSETVYPTTYGQPQSPAGADFDHEILQFVQDTGVALMFGTYERDAAGEYNVAAVLTPERGVLGRYRKTHPFPFTEQVPAWLDGAWLREWLPWTGTWLAGDGARVFPLRTADGRELQVQPLICLDAVRPELAIAGARLGAQALFVLSNDAWFSAAPQGARLHLAVAAFRSIETRLPQLRVTPNGLTAVIDPSGEVVAQSAVGDQAVLAGALPIADPPPTLMVRWGDWLGPVALGLLAVLGIAALGQRLSAQTKSRAGETAMPAVLRGVLLVPWQRWTVAGLRLWAAAVLIGLALQMLLFDGLQVRSLVQLRWFAGGVVLPLLLAWVLTVLQRVEVMAEPQGVALRHRRLRMHIPWQAVRALRAWRWPLPGAGLDLQLHEGRAVSLALPDPRPLWQWADRSSGAKPAAGVLSLWALSAAQRGAARWHWLDHGAIKFVVYPLLPALVAFRLHQVIAFGGAWGEALTFGLGAWLTGLVLWWAAWMLGLMLLAALLRMAIEVLWFSLYGLARAYAEPARRALEGAGRAVYYLGVPTWLLLRLTTG